MALTASGSTAQVYGPVTRRTELAIDAQAAHLGIQFRPGQSRRFLCVPAQEITDGALPATAALATDLRRATAAMTPQRALYELEVALLCHLARSEPLGERIDFALRRLQAECGNLRVAALAEQCGVSRRQIERDFLDAIGLSPKRFASILRLDHAAQQLRAGLAPAEVAALAGYADQSHLHAEFRRLIHLTPSGYARGDVAFLQDVKDMDPQDAGLS